MALKTVIVSGFSGGMSESQERGISESARLVKQLDIQQDPAYATLNLAPTKVSGTTVTNLVKWAVDGNPWDTNRYFYDAGGNLYKETSGGAWSVDRSGATIGNGAAGQGLFPLDDYLYYSTSTTIGRKGKLSGTPTFNDDFFSDGTINLDTSQTKSGQTYTTPTSISEAATALCSFTPTKDPVKSIAVIATAKGTGNWTLTVHDSNNILIGSQIITNANLINGTNTFTFATPLRVINNNVYHFHVTSTVADGTVQTGTTADLSTANFTELFGILVADTNFHPIIGTDLGSIVIGNERYLAFWDGATYSPNKVSFGQGFQVRSLHKENEFIVALAWRGNSTDNVLEARAFYWDGIATQYNYSKPISLGLPNAGINFKNRTTTILGTSGTIYMGTDPFQVFQPLPTLAAGKKIIVNPGAVTEWQGRLMVGYGASTDDANLYQGVYGFGNLSDRYPEVLSLDFIISSGVTQNSSAQIGMVKGFGKDLYIGWYDGTNYGVDKVSKGGNSAASGTWQSLIIDNDNDNKSKYALRVIIKFVALASGESVAPIYRLDRATNFTTGTADSTVGDTRLELPIFSLFKEAEFGFNLAATNTFPKVSEIQFEYDDLVEERGDR